MSSAGLRTHRSGAAIREPGTSRAWASAGLPILIFIFLVASRWATAPRYLHSFDSVNFALALEHFDPAHHQPQPPGYIFFVGLTRLVHLLIPSAERVLLVAGLLAAVASLLVIRSLADRIFAPPAGVLAMALLASDPVLWYGGLTNPVRVFLALSSLAVAALAWRALDNPGAARPLYAAYAVAGLAAGFRAEAVLLLAPLLVWTWWRSSGKISRLFACALATTAGALPAAVATAVAVGGTGKLYLIFWAYIRDQFQGTSAFFGAPAAPARHMALAALVWTFIGAAAWVWSLAWGFPRRTPAAFFAWWFLPPFLFSATVHIGDPDHALAAIAALSTFGGAVLARLAVSKRRYYALAAGVVAIHAGTFFFPTGELAHGTSYRAVEDVETSNRNVLSSIDTLRREGPLTVLWMQGAVTFRHLQWYFPEDYILVIPGTPAHPEPSELIHVFHRHAPLPPPSPDGRLRPGSHRVVCVCPRGSMPTPPWRDAGAVFIIDEVQGRELTVAGHRLRRF